MNLRELQQKFFDHLVKSHKSLNTIKNYRTDLNSFNQFLKSKGYTDFETTAVRAYGDFLQTKYNSDNSRRRKIQTLRIFYDFAMAQGVVSSNPVKEIPTSPKFLDIPRPTPLIDIKTLWVHLLDRKDSSEMAELITLRNQILMLLIFGAGLKVSELAKLKMDHLFEGPRVLIDSKRGDPYTIPLPSVFSYVLQKYKVLLEGNNKGLLFEEVLFNANAHRILSGGLSPRGIELILEELRNQLSIHLTPKSLRQACIFKWMCQKIPTESIKEWMGVAPSYDLDIFSKSQNEHIYGDEFLFELYKHYKKPTEILVN